MNEDKRYPQINEEDGSCPRTLDDVKAELREAEAAWDDDSQWCTSEEMWAEIKQTFPWANFSVDKSEKRSIKFGSNEKSSYLCT